MTAGYVQRAITLTIQVGKGSYGESGFDTVTLAGLRVQASIQKTGSPSMNLAQVRVFGITQSMMNQLATLGMAIPLRNNILTVSAGDSVSGISPIFQGTITDAFADYSTAPDVAFCFVANAGAIEAMRPVPPTSFGGSADVGIIMAGLAETAGLLFSNSGVSVQLSNPYFPGTARDQMKRCAEAAGINWIIDDGTLAIWPQGGHRGGSVPLISPQTGLIGYPTFNRQGPTFQALLNQAVTFGSLVQLQSSMQAACGTYVVYGLSYDLASETPGGPWFMTVAAADPNLLALAPA